MITPNPKEYISNKPINLLICSNNEYLQYAVICAHSYLKNALLNLDPVFVIDESVDESKLVKISSLFSNSRYIKIDSNIVLRDFPNFYSHSNYHISAMYRLYAIQALNNQLTLYVDADTICRGPLTGLETYIYSLQSDNMITTKKMVLMK